MLVRISFSIFFFCAVNAHAELCADEISFLISLTVPREFHLGQLVIYDRSLWVVGREPDGVTDLQLAALDFEPEGIRMARSPRSVLLDRTEMAYVQILTGQKMRYQRSWVDWQLVVRPVFDHLDVRMIGERLARSRDTDQ